MRGQSIAQQNSSPLVYEQTPTTERLAVGFLATVSRAQTTLQNVIKQCKSRLTYMYGNTQPITTSQYENIPRVHEKRCLFFNPKLCF